MSSPAISLEKKQAGMPISLILLIALAVLVAGFSAVSRNFYSVYNLVSMVTNITFLGLTAMGFCINLVAGEVDRANQGLAPVEQVKAFALLEKELDHDDDEVTATMKVRRKTIYQKFAPLIREIYG